MGMRKAILGVFAGAARRKVVGHLLNGSGEHPRNRNSNYAASAGNRNYRRDNVRLSFPFRKSNATEDNEETTFNMRISTPTASPKKAREKACWPIILCATI